MLKTKKSNTKSLKLDELALPGDVNIKSKLPGAIYYSATIKNKILVPVYIWGEIAKPGLHFIPSETDFIKGISLAGGPSKNAKLENIKLFRRKKDNLKEYEFDLQEGGDLKTHNFKLEASDIIHIQRTHFYENRAYYTSLIGVVATILSSLLLYREVKKIIFITLDLGYAKNSLY